MKLIIADTGPLISLGIIGRIDLIEKIFGKYYIANAVWEELLVYENPKFDKTLLKEVKKHVHKIKSKNHLSVIMDYGESESVILYEELNADFLLIDDKKARTIAESFDLNCIGTIGLIIKAKHKGFVKELRPIFEMWLKNERYFSIKLINKILEQEAEKAILI